MPRPDRTLDEVILSNMRELVGWDDRTRAPDPYLWGSLEHRNHLAASDDQLALVAEALRGTGEGLAERIVAIAWALGVSPQRLLAARVDREQSVRIRGVGARVPLPEYSRWLFDSPENAGQSTPRPLTPGMPSIETVEKLGRHLPDLRHDLSREVLQQLRELQLGHIPGVVVTPAGRISFWPETAERILGHQQLSVMGQDWRTLLSPRADIGALTDFACAEATQDGITLWSPLPLRLPDGGEQWVTIESTPLQDSTGLQVGFGAAISAFPPPLNEFMAEHVPADAASFVTDGDSIILSWNDRAQEYFGWTAAEALGESALLINPQGADDHFWDSMARLVSTGKDRFSRDFLDREGRRFLAHAAVTAEFDSRRNLHRAYAFFWDKQELPDGGQQL